MNLFAIYIALLFLSIVPYLLFKNQFNKWCSIDVEVSKPGLSTNKEVEVVTNSRIIKENEDYSDFILRKSLSYLEYSSFFESYIESTDTTKLSPEFLQVFEAHKRKIQREVLNTTDSLQIIHNKVV
ncbi:hypothetical protein [uncultured Winogradskyella sp.]|uniref:hypothetical protein n=1 Tax=uncultured Winogradskyella sp. TaxID=395353 RepID=UPI0030D79BE6|tara:strand:- start:8690 stop:9067 length:378 start_codon:yes stop_codon:yes gene_type:complete